MAEVIYSTLKSKVENIPTKTECFRNFRVSSSCKGTKELTVWTTKGQIEHKGEDYLIPWLEATKDNPLLGEVVNGIYPNIEKEHEKYIPIMTLTGYVSTALVISAGHFARTFHESTPSVLFTFEKLVELGVKDYLAQFLCQEVGYNPESEVWRYGIQSTHLVGCPSTWEKEDISRMENGDFSRFIDREMVCTPDPEGKGTMYSGMGYRGINTLYCPPESYDHLYNEFRSNHRNNGDPFSLQWELPTDTFVQSLYNVGWLNG